MKRRDFLKITAPLSLAPLLLNGMPAKGVLNLFDFNEILVNQEFKGRHVVIIQMRGANDGLNTIIPYNQYAGYVQNRPTIHIPQSLLTTEIDASLPDEKRAYFNPVMTGSGSLQSLYDEGKVNVIQGIGYPTPNYSHFRSTDLVLSAKDGDFQEAANEGWMASYLATVYPEFSGSPTQQLPHPLGLQLGDSSVNMGYRHELIHNVGINAAGLAENTFYDSLSRISSTSHYQELLDYVKTIDNAADKYNTVISNAFNSGTNSLTYPDSYLGRQLQTVSRLLAGGLESKVLLTDQTGFDTHVTQVTGSGTGTLTGRHAVLLEEFSDAVYAFQKDIEALGLADKVVVITMSEFGRKIAENANNGTDHGDLSSWMVIGNGVAGGVTGRNIDLSAGMVNSSGRTEDIMQHDYRRMISTVVQDWLGNKDSVLSNMETDGSTETLLEYAGTNKLDLFKPEYKVNNSDLVDSFTDLDLIVRSLTTITTDGAWTYYADPLDSDIVYFGIEHQPVGGNTNTIAPSVAVYNLNDDGTGKDYFSATIGKEGTFVLGDYWNVDLGLDEIDGFVNVRFFVDPARITALQTEANAFKTLESSGFISGDLWFQTSDPNFLDPQSQIKPDGFSTSINKLESPVAGTYTSREYLQFNNVTELGNKGGGLTVRITDDNSGLAPGERPAAPTPGALFYNANTGTFEGWNGSAWVPLNL